MTDPVLDYVPPMELHLMLGITNDIVKALEGALMAENLDDTVAKWSKKLGHIMAPHHGGQFNGNQCRDLLDNTASIREMLENKGMHIAKPYLDAMDALNVVVKGCFGKELKEGYVSDIHNFIKKYEDLTHFKYNDPTWSKKHNPRNKKFLNITPKVHALAVHVRQFLEKHKTTEPLESALDLSGTPKKHRGLGYWSEQASESVHHKFTQRLEKGNYKRRLILDDPERLQTYKTKLLSAVVSYNSQHENPLLSDSETDDEEDVTETEAIEDEDILNLSGVS